MQACHGIDCVEELWIKQGRKAGMKIAGHSIRTDGKFIHNLPQRRFSTNTLWITGIK